MCSVPCSCSVFLLGIFVCTVVYDVLGYIPSTSITSISGGQLLSAGTSQNAGQIPLPPGIVSPFLRKIKRAIDESMTMTQYVGSEDADLTVRDLACGTSVLPRHPARRLALLEQASLVDPRAASSSAKLLDDIIADDIAQAIRIPIPAPQDRLLPPRARIASYLRAHPSAFALLITEQTFEK